MASTPLRWARLAAEGGFRPHRINIGPRLTVCFLLIILAMLAGNAVLLWQFQQAQKQAERLTGADQVLIAVLQAHTGLMSFYERLDILAQSKDTHLLLKQIETLHNALLEHSQRIRNALNRLPPEVRLDPALMPTLLAIQGELPAQLQAIANLGKSGAWNSVQLRLANQVRPLESRSAELVENVDREVGEQRAQAVLNIRRAHRRIFLTLPVTAVITLLFAALLGSLITRSITQPLGRLVQGATALARGDFSHRVPGTGNDEITRLGSVFNDMIVKLQEAYRELQARERELRLIINTIPALAWSARADGFVEFFNQHYLDYTGLSAQQATGWNWTTAIHSDDLEDLTAAWQRIVGSGEPGEAEARLRRFDGAYRWFLFRANPLRDESGKIVKWYGTNLDIQDRKRGEEALRASELSWRQIVDNIPGLVATTGGMGEVEFLNRQTLEYFGKTSEELKEWALIDAVHPDDLPRVIEARKKSIETGQMYEVEHRCRRADGVYRWFQVRGLPVRDQENKITAWYLLLTDIDDRKKADEALQSSERNLSLMINAIPTFIHVLRTDGSVLYVNRAVLDYTGLTLEDVQKEDYRSRVFHPEDVERLREQRRQALTRAVPFENEQRVLSKDGKYRWFLIRYNPLLDEQGRIDRWYVAAIDIEDRKRAEAQVEQAYLRLAEAQSVSKTGSFVTDLVADDHNWSEEAFRIFEFDPAAKVTVQMIRDTVHPDDLPSFDSVIARGMTGTDVDFVFRIVTPRGGVKHIRGMARVIEQIAGRPLFIGALQDVTESKVAEAALNEARSELAHVTRVTTLNALTASIAHEVNQPLSGIVSNGSACLRWLAGDAPDLNEIGEAVRDIVRDGKRAADVIARIRALVTKRTTPLEKLDLNDAIRDVLAIVGDEAKRKSVMIRTQFADEVLPIFGDRVQLQQVVLNLVMNGLEAMSTVSERARELVITTGNIDAGQVQVTVEDSGSGLDPNTTQRIFDPFYTTKPSGMGMGLSISRSILQNHGGRLWAAPNDGPGASFHFTLPIHHEEERRARAAGV